MSSLHNFDIERENSIILQKHFISLISGDQKQQWEERNKEIDRKLRLMWTQSLKTGEFCLADDVSEREKSVILSRMWKDAIERAQETSWLNLINHTTDICTSGSFFRGSQQSRRSGVLIKPCAWLDLFGTQTEEEEGNWLSDVVEKGRMNSAPVLAVADLKHVQQMQQKNQDISKTSTQPISHIHPRVQEGINYSGAKEYSPANTSPSGPLSTSSTPSEKNLEIKPYKSGGDSDIISSINKQLELTTEISNQEINEISLHAKAEILRNSNDNVEKWLSNSTSRGVYVSTPDLEEQNVQQNSVGMSSRVNENSLNLRENCLRNRKEVFVEEGDVEENVSPPKKCMCCTIM